MRHGLHRRLAVGAPAAASAMAMAIALAAAVLVAAMASGDVAEAGGGGCTHEAVTAGATTAIDMRASCFTPAVAQIAAGEAVTWTNGDAFEHALSGASGTFGAYRTLGRADTHTIRFERAGIYPYFCPLHPGMAGAIVVGNGDAAGGGGRDGAGAGRDTDAVALTAATHADSGRVGGNTATAGAAARAAGAVGWLALGIAAGAVGTLGTGRLRRRG
jgi:plastocyanin